MPTNIDSLQTADPEALQGIANQLLSLAKGKGKSKGKKGKGKGKQKGNQSESPCPICNRSGHTRSECLYQTAGQSHPQHSPSKGKGKGGGGKGKGKGGDSRQCWTCGQARHVASQSPRRGSNLHQMGYGTGAQNWYESPQQPAQRQHDPYAVNPLPYVANPPPYVQHAGNPLHAVTPRAASPHAVSPQAANPLPPGGNPAGHELRAHVCAIHAGPLLHKLGQGRRHHRQRHAGRRRPRPPVPTRAEVSVSQSGLIPARRHPRCRQRCVATIRSIDAHGVPETSIDQRPVRQ